MKIFVYEYITGGGLWREAPETAPAGSLLREGAAMVRAIIGDLSAIESVEVVALLDERLSGFSFDGCRWHAIGSGEQEQAMLHELAASSDYTLLIAPEIGGALFTRCQEVESAGGQLLGPSADYVAIASDKHATAERLRAAGVPAAEGVRLRVGDAVPPDFSLPAVLKPCRGAGSQGVRRIDRPQQLSEAVPTISEDHRLETYVPGLAASAAVLSGPGGSVALPACRQWLSDDGRFRYLGGSLPLDDALDRRARVLAEAAVRAIGLPRGYVGVDLVLGDAEHGSQDVVIEVNPRLTTSYIGLRRATRENLAEALLDIARGADRPLSFSGQEVRFRA
ncbi:MAG: ATP-grasp domain-containing protein [Pirellulaceae bacterium]